MFASFAPQLQKRARVGQLIAASPLNMGLLTPTPPNWHPAPAGLRSAVNKATEACRAVDWPGGLASVALGYAMRRSGFLQSLPADVEKSLDDIPTVVGLSTPEEVHEAVKNWREVNRGGDHAKREEIEQAVITIFKESGFFGWSWQSP